MKYLKSLFLFQKSITTDRPIGDIFEFEGVRLKVEESRTCDNCFLKNRNYCCDKRTTGYCGAAMRKDKKYVSFVKIEENMFTKDDLKTGMVVECRNGNIYIFVEMLKRKLLIRIDYPNEDFDWYDDNLCNKLDSQFDIIRVYSGVIDLQLSNMFKFKGTLLWERPAEKVELTLEQIAEKFNIPVDSLRIKD